MNVSSPITALIIGAVGFLGGYATRARLQTEHRDDTSSDGNRLRDAGALVIGPATSAALEQSIENEIQYGPLRKDQVAGVEALAPGARPVEVRRMRTEPSAALPRPSSPAAAPPRAPCAIEEGEALELRVSEVDLATQGGSRVVVGAGEVWTVEAPAHQVFRAPFAARLSSVKELEQSPPVRTGPARVGLGLAAAWGSAGSFLGPVLTVSPLRAGPVDVELLAGLALELGAQRSMLGMVGVMGRLSSSVAHP